MYEQSSVTYFLSTILTDANLTTWGAKVPGALTDHGAAVVNRMGQFYASEYKAIGGLSRKFI